MTDFSFPPLKDGEAPISLPHRRPEEKDGNYEQWLYWRERRLHDLYEQYGRACMILRGFEHSSSGIALMEMIRRLEADLPDRKG